MNSLHYANDRLSVGKRMICSACGSGKIDREARAAPWRRQTCASAGTNLRQGGTYLVLIS